MSFVDVHSLLEVHRLGPVDELAGTGESSGDPLQGGCGVITTEGNDRCRVVVPGGFDELGKLTFPVHEVFKRLVSARIHGAILLDGSGIGQRRTSVSSESGYTSRFGAGLVVSGAAVCLAGRKDPAHVMTEGRAAVPRARWSAGPGLGRFRCTGWRAGLRAEVSEPTPDSGRRQSVRWGRLLPGPPQIGGQRAGRPELGIGRDHQQRPPIGCLRAAEPGLGPAECLLEQAKGVFQAEAPEEGLPAAVYVRFGGAGARPPQPDRLVHPAAGHFLHDQPEDGALDDGQRSIVVDPLRPAGQPRVQPRQRRGSQAVAVKPSPGTEPPWAPQVTGT